MTSRIVHHKPNWQPAQLRIDAAGTTTPGYVCMHQLENGNGTCGGTVLRAEQGIADHCCVVDVPPARQTG